MDGDNAIVAQDVVRSFGRLRALDGLDLEVRSGEMLGLVGPNGAGKTTFIRVVAGLLSPSAGTVRVFGERPGRSVAGRLGYMTQSPALYEDLTIVENLDFFGRVYGLSRRSARARGGELLELLRLSDKAETPVRALSGGQRQLANLAAAMIHTPRLLLLDEPTVGIDPVLRVALWEHFRRLQASGTTLLVTTHVLDEAERCDRVAFIASGRTIAVDVPAALRERAGATTLEAAFLTLSAPAKAVG
ncbi:MAG: ABC transporter ATP-binding protein [Actinomycetota bacterium]